MKIYVSEKRIILFILFSAFVYTFLYFPFFGWTVYSFSTSLCKLIVLVYVIANIEKVLNFEEFRIINLLACLYFFSVLISRILTGSFSTSILVNFFFQCSFFPFVELQKEKGHIGFLFRVFLFWLGICLFLNDVLMVILPGSFYGDGMSKNFFLGNKLGGPHHENSNG